MPYFRPKPPEILGVRYYVRLEERGYRNRRAVVSRVEEQLTLDDALEVFTRKAAELEMIRVGVSIKITHIPFTLKASYRTLSLLPHPVDNKITVITRLVEDFSDRQMAYIIYKLLDEQLRQNGHVPTIREYSDLARMFLPPAREDD